MPKRSTGQMVASVYQRSVLWAKSAPPARQNTTVRGLRRNQQHQRLSGRAPESWSSTCILRRGLHRRRPSFRWTSAAVSVP
eukprot:3536353-Rhodomonas_salina.3